MDRWPALMTKKMASEYLSISPRTLQRLVSGNEIPTKLIRSRSIRFEKAALDAWIQSLPSGQTAKEKAFRSPRKAP